MKTFTQWLNESSSPSIDSVWLVGRPEGHEMGLHDSVWGTLDQEEAASYAGGWQGDKNKPGKVTSFRIKPGSKVVMAGDKLDLLAKLWSWTPEVLKRLRAATPGDHRPWIEMMGGNIIKSPTANNTGWDLTQLDTLLTKKLKSEYDAAIMSKEGPSGQIVVVNQNSMEWQS